MKTHILMCSAVMAATTGLTHGAILKLENAADGSNTVVLPQGATAQINIVLVTQDTDTAGVQHLFAMFDTANPEIDVIAVTPGQPWGYDRSFTIPCDLGKDYLDGSGVEYYLNAGEIGTEYCPGPLPPGSGAYVIDTLTIVNAGLSEGVVEVTFETGIRQPFAFGCGPEYFPFITAVSGFPPGFPNVLYIGDEFSNNPPLLIVLSDIIDCNDNGVSDGDDILNQSSSDCNFNDVPDECDITTGGSADINENAVPDECEPPRLIGVTAWVEHGLLGPLPIELNIEGAVTTDPRLNAGGLLELTFAGVLNPEYAANEQLLIVERATGGIIGPEDMETNLTADGRVLRLAFPGLPSSRLANEEQYTFELAALGVVGDSSFDLRLLTGDLNGDGTVDPLDAGRVQTHFGESIPAFPAYDVNNDGVDIDPLDFAAILARLGDAAP